MNQPADLQTRNAKRRIAGLPSGTGMKGSVELIYDAVAKNEYLYFNQYGLYRSEADAGEQDFAKLVKASGSEYTKIATAGNFGDLRRNVLLTGEAVYMASENSAAVNSDLKLPAVGSLGAAAGQASYLPSQPFRTAGASGQGYTRSLGRKVYELTDHLGNVHATVSDRRIYDATLKASLPEVQSLADYYPFGMQMPGKMLNPERYRYGFNGKEDDREVNGWQDYGFREYNRLTARFITPDPLIVKEQKYPWYSPYHFAGNTPIQAIDLDGLEECFVTNYYNAARNLYKTEVTVVNSTNLRNSPVAGGRVSVVLHVSRVDVDRAGNATVNYLGSVNETNANFNTVPDFNRIPFIGRGGTVTTESGKQMEGGNDGVKSGDPGPVDPISGQTTLLNAKDVINITILTNSAVTPANEPVMPKDLNAVPENANQRTSYVGSNSVGGDGVQQSIGTHGSTLNENGINAMGRTAPYTVNSTSTPPANAVIMPINRGNTPPTITVN